MTEYLQLHNSMKTAKKELQRQQKLVHQQPKRESGSRQVERRVQPQCLSHQLHKVINRFLSQCWRGLPFNVFTGSADGDADEDVQSIDQVPLKTETPDYEDDDDLHGSGGDDTPDEHEIVQKLQKSDQLVLTSNRNRTSNSEHSLYGNNSMDMDSGMNFAKISSCP